MRSRYARPHGHVLHRTACLSPIPGTQISVQCDQPSHLWQVSIGWAMATSVAMMQQSVKSPDVPAEVRRGFVRKVYGILISMLVVSFAIAAPFVFRRHETVTFMQDHIWIVALTTAFLLLHQIINLAICLELCCGGGLFMSAYLRMFVTVPWNYIFSFTYAACFGVVLGFICSHYQAQSVVLVFLISATLMAALTIYAAVTKTDFTGFGMYLLTALVGLLIFAAVAAFVSAGTLLHKAISVLGAVIFSFMIIYDTQLILGTMSLELGWSAARQVEFTLDMYCFAAYQLYLDFVNLFLYLLDLLGRARQD